MIHITRYSPTTRLFYLGEQTELPSDAYIVTPDQVVFITRQNQVIPDYSEIDELRRTAYAVEVDPLLSEAALKRALGLNDEANKLTVDALNKRLQIQQRHPKTPGEIA